MGTSDSAVISRIRAIGTVRSKPYSALEATRTRNNHQFYIQLTSVILKSVKPLRRDTRHIPWYPYSLIQLATINVD